MKATSTTTNTHTTRLLKAIDKQLNAILEEDMRKLHKVEDTRIRYSAFLQLIAA